MSDIPEPVIRPRRWLRRSGYATVIIAAAAAIAIVLLPTIAGWQIESQLEKLGARSVELEGLSINPATGEISVKRFRSVGPDGEDISVGASTIKVGIYSLARRRVVIQDLTVTDADIDVRLDTRGRWSVGGFPMDFAEDKAKPDSEEPWQLKAENLAIDNSRMTLAIGNTVQTAMVEKLRMDILSTLRPNVATTIHLSARTADGMLKLDGKAYPFAAEPNIALAMEMSGIDLKTFEGLVATGRLKSVGGTATMTGELVARQTKGGGAEIGYIGNASVARMKTETTLFASRSEDLSWSGRSRVRFAGPGAPAGTLPEIRLNGVAAATAFRFENMTSRMALAAKTARFDFSKTGIEMRADPARKDASEIIGAVVARLTEAWLDDPDSDLKIAPRQLDIRSDVRLNLPAGTPAFSARLSGTLGVRNLKSELKSAGIDGLTAATLTLAYDDAVLALDAKGGLSTSASTKLEITGLSLDAPQLGLSASAEQVRSDGQKIAFDGTGKSILLKTDGGLQAENVRAKDANGQWESIQKKFAWRGKISLGGASAGEGTAPSATVSGDASATGFSATLSGKDAYSIALDDARLNGISIDGDQSRIDTASLTGISASDGAKTSALPRLRMKSLRLSGVSATGGNRLVLNSIRGSGLTGSLVRTKSGTIALPDYASGRTAPADAPPPRPAEKPGSIRIDDATLTDSTIIFTDISTNPEFAIETSRLQASLKGLDTARPISDAAFDILVGLGKFGRIDAKGSFKPVFDRVTANIAVGFKNIEMFKFNAYIAPAINHNVRQGRADGSMEVALRNSEIKASTSLVLNRLKVKPVPAPAGTVNEGGKATTGGPPMETAIGLLENDKGIIKLSIPISGSLDDPRFDFSNAVGQAVAGAMQKTLLTAVKIAFPLGTVVAIVDAVGNPKIEINPLNFAAGTFALTPELKNRIAEIATYLKKKPDAAPSICGPATSADLAVLQQRNPRADKAAAIKTAANRMLEVREELVAEHSIDPNRLYLCDPDFTDGADAESVIRIGLKE